MKPHQRKYYGCLLMVFCMIVGTLVLFATYDTDLTGGVHLITGMHGAEEDEDGEEEVGHNDVLQYEQEILLKEGGSLFFEFDKDNSLDDIEYSITYNSGTGTYWVYGHDDRSNYDFGNYQNALNYMKNMLNIYTNGVQANILDKDDRTIYTEDYEKEDAEEMVSDFSTVSTTDTSALTNAISIMASSPESSSTTSTTSDESSITSTTAETTTIAQPSPSSPSSGSASSPSSSPTSSSTADRIINWPEGEVASFTKNDGKTVKIYATVQQNVGSSKEKVSGQVFISNNEGDIDAYNFVQIGRQIYLVAPEPNRIIYINTADPSKTYELKGDVLEPAVVGFGLISDEIINQIDETIISDKLKPSPQLSITVQNNLMTKEEETKQAYDKQLTSLASSLASDLGTNNINAVKTMLTTEQNNVNNYLDEDDKYKSLTYDILTDTYSGLYEDYLYAWKDDSLHITINEKTYYKETYKGKTTYYQMIDGKPTRVTGDDIAEVKSEFKKAEKVYEDIEEYVEDERDNKNGELETSLREQAYMNRIYREQEQQVKGLITGWLNNALDKALGGWSKGVPAGICKYVFGLEYYKNQGFVSMPGNTSAEQLQSTLIANSRTVIIEGEKEEITENLYRYAYTLRLLANTGMEWQTYLYNSCTGENSIDIFYDYGSLSTAEYYSFHYAGAGEQDMIFDCTIESCLFDQACVQFSDESEPICVSLVHGAGFETPDAGRDYDCI